MRGPVEPGPVHDEELLLAEQVEGEPLVVPDRVDLGVEAREEVERALRLGARDPRDLVEHLPGAVALLEESTARQDQLVDRLVAAQGDLNGVLGRHVGAQTHVREDLEALDVAAGVLLRAGEGQPPGTEPGHAVRLGEAVEGEAEQVRGEGGDRRVLRVVVEDLVVDLVGHDDQLVPAGQLGDALEDVDRVDGARGVVRVDDDDRLGPVGDLARDVVEVGRPPRLLVAEVVHGGPAGQGRGGRPQRVVRRRDEDLVAVVEQALHRHDDELADAVAQVDVLDVETGEVADLVVLLDGASRADDALAVAVALGGRQRADHVDEDVVRRLEAERRRVADVELEDPVPLVLEPFGLGEHRSADLVADGRELLGLGDEAHALQGVRWGWEGPRDSRHVALRRGRDELGVCRWARRVPQCSRQASELASLVSVRRTPTSPLGGLATAVSSRPPSVRRSSTPGAVATRRQPTARR